MQSKKTIRLMVGASLFALSVGALSNGAFAQTAGQTNQSVSDDNTVSEVIVVGARRAEQSAIERKRRAATVSDSIVADDVGQFPDKSAAEAIARISGVALDVTDSGESGGFTIRGQSADLIRIEVDGMTTLDNTTGQGGRSAQLNELSSDLIKSVDVIKGQTADMTPGGVGGTVRIEQRNGLDFAKPLYRLNIQGQRSNLNDEWTPRVNAIVAGRFLDGRLGVLINATYDRAETTQDFARIADKDAGYIPLGDHDNSPNKTFVQQYDPLAASVQLKSDCAFLPTNTDPGTGRFAGRPATSINSRLNCYAQWEDWTPSLVRYGRGYREDTKTSYQVRLDFRVSDNLTVFASYNPNIREFKSKDFNLSVATPTGSTSTAGALTTNFRALEVNPNHYVTKYAFVRPTAANPPVALAGAATIASLTEQSQIRDINRDQEQIYYQTGADFEWGKWSGKARAQYGTARAEREDLVFNAAAPLDSATFSIIPGSGIWTVDMVGRAGQDLSNPATWLPEIPANGVATHLEIQYPQPQADKSSEKALQLDMIREFDGDAGIFTRFKWGIQTRDFENQTWREGGALNLAPGLYQSRARSIDRLRVCTTAAVQNGLCVLGSVPLNNVSPTTTTSDQLYKLHSLTPEQYLEVLSAGIQDLPGGQFFGDISDGEGLLDTWTTFNTEAVYDKLRQYIDLSDWNKSCLYECRANDGKIYPKRSFATSEKTMSAYAMLDFESEVFGMNLQGNMGVRFQKIDVAGQTVRVVFNRSIRQPTPTTYDQLDTLVTTEEVVVNRSSQDALPSLNLSLWPMEDKLAVRYSIAKQRARPSLTQLTGVGAVNCYNVDEGQQSLVDFIVANNPTAIVDSDANTDDTQEAANFAANWRDRCTSRIGNPALVGYGAITQNLSMEWYPNRDTQVSLAAYEIAVKTGRPEGVRDPLYDIGGNTYDVDTYADGEGGLRTRGIELAARTAFTFLPSILRHTGGGFNMSTAKSSQSEAEFDRLTGKFLPPKSESSYYYNVNLWYDDGRINARVAYQARDIYFQNFDYESTNRVPAVALGGEDGGSATSYFKIGSPYFRSKTNTLDARASFKLNERVQFFVEGKNLLDDTQYRFTPTEYREIEEGTTYRWDNTYVGRRYYAGVTLTF